MWGGRRAAGGGGGGAGRRDWQSNRLCDSELPCVRLRDSCRPSGLSGAPVSVAPGRSVCSGGKFPHFSGVPRLPGDLILPHMANL
jgi:hypothetical protein